MPQAKRVEAWAQGVVLLAGLRCAVAGRNLTIGSDGLAYLDVGRAYLRHDWSIAVNGYWGPFYCWLLAAAIRIVHPDARQEFAALRGVNLAILVLLLYAFGRFWRSVSVWNRRFADGGVPLADVFPVGWVLLGYALFLTKVVWLVEAATPDLLVSAIVLLIAGELFELDDGQPHGILRYAALGVLIALGIYAKAILFYFGLFVLLALMIRSFRSRNYRGPITAALVCALLVSPFIAALTRTLGHFSVGDSGRLNYAWFVDGTEPGPWSEGGASFPFYPGPVALNFPRVYHIPHLEGVTYAPWYDAARFDDHSHATFSLRGQVRQLSLNLRSLSGEVLGAESALLVCAIALISMAPKGFLARFTTAWFCTVPVLLVIGMYLLVHLVDRFTLGFLLVLWGIAYSCIRIPSDLALVAKRVLLCSIAVFALSTFPGLLHFLFSPAENLIVRDANIAEALPNYGIRSGDSVALIGDGQVAYWAHWAGLSIVAEVPSMDSTPFWSASFEAQRTALRAMEDSGAKAVIWKRDSDRPCPRDWVLLPKDSGCLILLNPPPSHSG